MVNINLHRILICIFIIICICLVLLVIINERWSDGDEVHYLLVTASIINDFDLQLENNYQNKDYFDHHANEERPHRYIGKNEIWRPAGGIFTSIIMVPAYQISLLMKKYFDIDSSGSFLFFPRMTILVLHILFSLMLVYFLNILGFNKNISLLSAILFMVQLPIVLYSQVIYSDLIAAYFNMMGILGVLLFTKRNRYKWLILSGIFFGINIFVHSKQIILTALLIMSSIIYLYFYLNRDNKYSCMEFLRSKRHWKIIFNLLYPWLIFLFANIAMKYYWFGKFLFDGIGDKTRSRGYFALIENPLRGWLGQWLDIEVGMLWNGPVFALIFIGLFLWYRNAKSSFLYIIPPLFIYLSITASVEFWDGGFCPPGRQVLISIPLLMPSIAWVLKAGKKMVWIRWLIGFLTLISLSLSALIPFVGRRGLPYFKGYNIYWQTILRYIRISIIEPFISLNFFDPKIYDYAIGIIIFISLFIIGYILRNNYIKVASHK